MDKIYYITLDRSLFISFSKIPQLFYTIIETFNLECVYYT